MKNPYQILGIDRNATPEEIKKAYRAASRKYHPDSNPDNPKYAEEMFKEVQQAYRDIIEGRAEQSDGSAAGTGYTGRASTGTGYAGRTGTGYQGAGYQRTAGSGYNASGNGGKTTYAGNGQRMDSGTRTKKTYGQPGKPVCDEHDSRELKDAAACINGGCYKEALKILDTIQMRGDKWYYFSAIANNGARNNLLARQQIESAIFLNPNNLDYVIFKQRIEAGMSWYQKQNSAYDKPYVGKNSEWSLGDILLRIFCMICTGF